MNIFANFHIGYCYDTYERSSVFTGEIIVDIPNVSLAFCSDIESIHLVYKASVNSQDKHGEQLNFMYFACKNTRNDSKVCCPLIGTKTRTFSGTNQKPEQLRPFGTGLVKHCPQGLFSPSFTFLGATFSPARLDFPSPPLFAPGSPRMCCLQHRQHLEFHKTKHACAFCVCLDISHSRPQTHT